MRRASSLKFSRETLPIGESWQPMKMHDFNEGFSHAIFSLSITRLSASDEKLISLKCPSTKNCEAIWIHERRIIYLFIYFINMCNSVRASLWPGFTFQFGSLISLSVNQELVPALTATSSREQKTSSWFDLDLHVLETRNMCFRLRNIDRFSTVWQTEPISIRFSAKWEP